MKEQEALEIFYNETESRWTDNTGWFNDEPKFEEPPAQRRKENSNGRNKHFRDVQTP